MLASPADPPAGAAGELPHTAVRTLDRNLLPDTSTGNRHFDLLLDLQGRPDAQGRRVAPLSAASASAAAAELAALRARAAQGPREPQSEADRPPPARTGLSLNAFDGLGLMQVDPRADGPETRRRWSGPSDGNSRQPPGATGPGEDPLLNQLRQAVQYLRENGVWLFALGGLLALIGAALKAYSRRI